MLRRLIAWCLLAPLLCLLAVGIALIIGLVTATLALLVCALAVIQWADKKNAKYCLTNTVAPATVPPRNTNQPRSQTNMGIESNIAELTAAVRELTAAITGAACAGKCVPASPEQIKEMQANEAPAKPKAEAKKETAKPAPTAKQEPAATQATATDTASAPEHKAENSAAPLDYEKDVKPLFLKLVSTKGRDVAVKLITDFKPGAAKLNDAIGPEQYADAVAKINELLAG